MNIERQTKKDDLKSDPLVDSLVVTKTFIQANSKIITGVIAAVAFAAVVYVAYSQMQKASLRNAQEAFGKAMIAYSAGERATASELFTVVYDNHGSTVHGQYAAYLLGTMLLEEGDSEGAIRWLEKAVAKGAKGGFVRSAALEALAAAYEHKGDAAQAVTLLRRVLTDKSAAYRHSEVRWKLAVLSAEQIKIDDVALYCGALISDTTATEYHQNAKNLIARFGKSVVQ